MRIDRSKKLIIAPVGAVATFQPFGTAPSRTGSWWRMTEGREWHRKLQEEAVATSADRETEVAIDGMIRHRDWELRLEGRIDLIERTRNGNGRIVEIKTIRGVLPQPEAALRESHPAYFRQTALYQLLWSQYRGEEAEAEVRFVDPETGVRQSLVLGAEDREELTRHLDGVVHMAEHQDAPPFQLRESVHHHARTGQLAAYREMSAALETCGRVFFQAPTGFGKTALVLEAGIDAMRHGVLDRILFLSARTTGQETVAQEWRRLLGNKANNGGLPWRVPSRSQCWPRCAVPGCDAHRCPDTAGPDLAHALAMGQEDHETLFSRAAALGFCPYRLHHGLLPLHRLWIGDLNYVFAPGSCHTLLEQPFFDATRTLLVVDEAHHLPARARENLGLEVHLASLGLILGELEALAMPHRPLRALRRWIALIEDLDPSVPVPLEDRYELEDIIEEVLLLPPKVNECASLLGSETWNWMLTLPHWRKLLRQMDDGEHLLLWKPKGDMLRLSVMDASSWIREQTMRFGRSIFMSATIDPVEVLSRQCGFSGGDYQMIRTPDASGLGRLEVAVDRRVDTRWRERRRYFETTARTAIELYYARPDSPVAVFFSSYRYARDVAAYCQSLDSGLRIFIPGAGTEAIPSEQVLADALASDHLLFLILGGRFAESINLLGGRIHTAMVVGPGLPEVSLEQQFAREKGSSFEELFLIPGLRKVQQAVGRLVRAPEQNARVLLHCRRFADSRHRDLLPDSWREAPILKTDREVATWAQGGHHSETSPLFPHD